MTKQIVINDEATRVLDKIRDDRECSYSIAILHLNKRLNAVVTMITSSDNEVIKEQLIKTLEAIK